MKNMMVLARRAVLAIPCIVSSLPKQLMIGAVKTTMSMLQSVQNEVVSIMDQRIASFNRRKLPAP